jgi:hypothetical protein
MKDSQDSEFPVKIDLGRQVPDYSGEMAAAPSGKKRKMKTSYPSLYIDGGADLAKLQKEGWALIKYKRTSVRIGKSNGPSIDSGAAKDEDSASAEIEVQQLCLPDKGGDVMDEFAKFAKAKGVDTGGMGGDDDEDEETPAADPDAEAAPAAGENEEET